MKTKCIKRKYMKTKYINKILDEYNYVHLDIHTKRWRNIIICHHPILVIYHICQQLVPFWDEAATLFPSALITLWSELTY